MRKAGVPSRTGRPLIPGRGADESQATLLPACPPARPPACLPALLASVIPNRHHTGKNLIWAPERGAAAEVYAFLSVLYEMQSPALEGLCMVPPARCTRMNACVAVLRADTLSLHPVSCIYTTLHYTTHS